MAGPWENYQSAAPWEEYKAPEKKIEKIDRTQGMTKKELADMAAGLYVHGAENLFGKFDPKDIGRSVIRPAMQMGGAALGATATAPIPGASIIGAGAGYMGGGKLYDIGESALGLGKPKTTKQVVGEMPREFAEGAVSQVFNNAIDYAATKAAPYLRNMAEKTYSSAAKMSSSRSWIASRNRIGGPMSDVELATSKALEKEIPVSTKGLEKARIGEKETKQAVDNIVDELTQQGKITNTADLLKGTDEIYYKTINGSGDVIGSVRAIDSVVEKFMQRPGKLTPQNILDIKRQMYKEGAAAFNIPGKYAGAKGEALQGISIEAKKVLEGMNPTIGRLNQDDAAYIKLIQALESATARESKKYAFGLTEGIGAAGGAAYGALKGGDAKTSGEYAAAGAMMTKILRDPTVLSNLSFALNKASKMKPNPLLERVLSTVLAKGTVSAVAPEKQNVSQQ